MRRQQRRQPTEVGRAGLERLSAVAYRGILELLCPLETQILLTVSRTLRSNVLAVLRVVVLSDECPRAYGIPRIPRRRLLLQQQPEWQPGEAEEKQAAAHADEEEDDEAAGESDVRVDTVWLNTDWAESAESVHLYDQLIRAQERQGQDDLMFCLHALPDRFAQSAQLLAHTARNAPLRMKVLDTAGGDGSQFGLGGGASWDRLNRKQLPFSFRNLSNRRFARGRGGGGVPALENFSEVDELRVEFPNRTLFRALRHHDHPPTALVMDRVQLSHLQDDNGTDDWRAVARAGLRRLIMRGVDGDGWREPGMLWRMREAEVQTLRSLLLPCCSLQEVDFNLKPVSGEIMLGFVRALTTHCDTLRYVGIGDLSCMSDADIAQCIEALYRQQPTPVESSGSAAAPTVGAHRSLAIHHLNLRGALEAGHHVVHTLRQCAASCLQVLHIGASHHLQDADVSELCAGCPSLTELHLNGCLALTPLALQAALKHSAQLTLFHCRSLERRCSASLLHEARFVREILLNFDTPVTMKAVEPAEEALVHWFIKQYRTVFLTPSASGPFEHVRVGAPIADGSVRAHPCLPRVLEQVWILAFREQLERPATPNAPLSEMDPALRLEILAILVVDAAAAATAAAAPPPPHPPPPPAAATTTTAASMPSTWVAPAPVGDEVGLAVPCFFGCGATWTCDRVAEARGAFLDHAAICTHAPVSCLGDAMECGALFPRHQWHEHREQACCASKIACPFCFVMLTTGAIQQHIRNHLDLGEHAPYLCCPLRTVHGCSFVTSLRTRPMPLPHSRTPLPGDGDPVFSSVCDPAADRNARQAVRAHFPTQCEEYTFQCPSCKATVLRRDWDSGAHLELGGCSRERQHLPALST